MSRRELRFFSDLFRIFLPNRSKNIPSQVNLVMVDRFYRLQLPDLVSVLSYMP